VALARRTAGNREPNLLTTSTSLLDVGDVQALPKFAGASLRVGDPFAIELAGKDTACLPDEWLGAFVHLSDPSDVGVGPAIPAFTQRG
jgi:hypothetical protein